MAQKFPKNKRIFGLKVKNGLLIGLIMILVLKSNWEKDTDDFSYSYFDVEKLIVDYTFSGLKKMIKDLGVTSWPALEEKKLKKLDKGSN